MLYEVITIENTHNRAGGVIFPQDEVERICQAAREHEVASYLDGARLWNTAVALNRPTAELAAPFDLVSVALSKGLGAPGGSLLAGSKALIRITSYNVCYTKLLRVLSEMIRVTRPGGRVGVIVRAFDIPFFFNLPLSPEVKAIAENNCHGGSAGSKGCDNASLYRRFQMARNNFV